MTGVIVGDTFPEEAVNLIRSLFTRPVFNLLVSSYSWLRFRSLLPCTTCPRCSAASLSEDARDFE